MKTKLHFEETKMGKRYQPKQKIKVFISSKCDKTEETPKYNPVRAELKQAIEQTGLATAYIFEAEGASTLNAGDHFAFALEDSDVCIFLIDNADGIPEGVQKEIDIVQKKHIKSLFYFCDENKKEKTALEKSLMGADFAKSKTVHAFKDLSQNSAVALIDDIVSIYHSYCKGRLEIISENHQDEILNVDITAVNKYSEVSVPKSVLENIDKTADYILKNTTGLSLSEFSSDSVKTSKLDDWGVQFLPILFEGKSIKEFNSSLFLVCLEELQEKEYFSVVDMRWKAIQFYFNGDVPKCVETLQKALEIAKATNQPSWVIKDILIDLRNQQLELCTEKNIYSKSEAQKELEESEEEVYYPILDRSNESLQDKYIQELYKQTTESPYTVTLGSGLNQDAKLLAGTFIVTLYNGSLTHILLIYNRIKDFLFYLSNRYDDWNFKRELLKYAIKTGTSKEVAGLLKAYPEILEKLSEQDAEDIMAFCSQYPIYYRKVHQQLLAFGTVGYYLTDETFKFYESQITDMIYSWLEDEKATVAIGQSIFNNLSNISYRLSQDTLADMCCEFIDKHYYRWYMDMFRFISTRIDIRKMHDESAVNLINHMISVLQDEDAHTLIQPDPSFLFTLRKQNKSLTDNLDKAIEKYLPDYYQDTYRLETTDDEKTELPQFVKKYVQTIKSHNSTQGKNGMYVSHGTNEISTIRSILLYADLPIADDLMDSIVETVAQTLLEVNETVPIKMDAIALLCCIIIKYPQAYIRNKKTYQKIFDCADQIPIEDDFPFSANVDEIALKISLEILFSTMGIDVHVDLLEWLPYLQDNTATTIYVSNFIAKHLEISDEFTFDKPTEAVILHNAFGWLHTNYIDIKWNATRILLASLRNPENQAIINRQIVSLIDTGNVYIKNLILQRISKTFGITKATKDYVLEICENDANYVTRELCKNIRYNR